MTTKERRLVFTYSKVCHIDNELNHCISLLSKSEYDKDFENDSTVTEIRSELANIEDKLCDLKLKFERYVNSMTDYGEKDKND